MLRTFGSVFSGIGGFELGLHPLGIKPAWQVEQDLFCREVLQKHWNAVVPQLVTVIGNCIQEHYLRVRISINDNDV
jgi:site-specific DNA-cytosine methylase